MMSHENDGRKARTLTLRLSDEDAERLYIKAGTSGLYVEELLENFIQDLTLSSRSNGSDEEDLANQWFDRCRFGTYSDRNFLKFVTETGKQEWVAETWTDLQEAKKSLAIGLSEFCDQEEMDGVREDAEYWQEGLEAFYEEFKGLGDGDGKSMEEDFQELVQWKKGMDAFMEGGPHDWDVHERKQDGHHQNGEDGCTVQSAG